ncbi:hypothetical protein B0H34DRAFT_748513 [Crassisporium funariophilum]|nr:hypothetical protein B0H34DRAFT_748513 [Crassisporium funariophilum]
MSVSSRKASLQLDFIIVGASIGGLATAFALARSGHRVRVYEKSDGILERTAGIRVPPNLCKILYEWGLQEQLSKASKCCKSAFHSLETNEIIGYIEWQDDVIRETGGDFLVMHYDELYRMLYTLATSEGATVFFNTEITSVSFDGAKELPTALLGDGTKLIADLIIGADGCHSVVREAVTEESDHGVPSGLTFFSITVPAETLKDDPDWSKWLAVQEWPVWMGDRRVLLAYPISGGAEFCVHAYWPETRIKGPEAPESWDTTSATSLLDFEGCHPSIKRIFSAVPDALRTKYVVREIVEDWVDESGTMLLIGEAAHSLTASQAHEQYCFLLLLTSMILMQPFTIQNCSLAVEDAAVLGVLMSYLTTRTQIPQFLEAFQDLRLSRVQKVHQSELNNAALVSLPPGEMQEMRDAAMRKSLTPSVEKWDDEQLRHQWEEIGEVFGYNARESAEDWWSKWGALGENTEDRGAQQPLGMVFQVTKVATQVD